MVRYHLTRTSAAAIVLACSLCMPWDSAHADGPRGFRHVVIDAQGVHAHVIAPAPLQSARTDRGRETATTRATTKALATNQLARFEPAKFGDALHAALKDQVIGYVMQLRQHGTPIQTRVWNWAHTPADGGSGWGLDMRMHVASVSKVITAIAMTKALATMNIDPGTPISGYLPRYWAQGYDVNKVTFANLLTHTSGFYTGQSASDYETMRRVVATSDNDVGTYHYENLNFGLCRILIPSVLGWDDQTATTYNPPSELDQLWDYVTVQQYEGYVQDSVFTPSGVSDASLEHRTSDALAYLAGDTGKGVNWGDLTTMSGGAGWHLTLNDLLAVMGTFRRSGRIMTSQQAQAMLDASFGIDWIDDTPLGKMYSKNGRFSDGGNHTEQSLVVFLPQDMELAMFVNSPVGGQDTFLYTLVRNTVLASID